MGEEEEAVIRPLMGKENREKLTLVVILSVIMFYVCSFAYGNIIAYASPAESKIMHDLSLTLSEYSVFVSIAAVGSLFGALCTGKTADLIGRRSAIGVSNLICVIGWFAIAFSKSAWSLYVGRLLMGFGIGLSSFAGYVYMAEIIPKNIRGTVMSADPLFMSCGKSLFFVIGPFVSWRALAIIGLVPYLFAILFLFFVPESPRWLMKIGKVEASENALSRIRGAKADISQEITDIKDYTDCSNKDSQQGVLGLFQKKYARCLIIGVGLGVLQKMGGDGAITSYMSSIFESAGFSGSIGSMLVGGIQILTSSFGVCFIDKFGRRPLLLISSSGTFLGCTLVALSFTLKSIQFGDKLGPVLALVGVLVFLGFFSLGLEGIPFLITSEIFPLNIKGAAASVVYTLCSAAAFIVSYSFNFMFVWNPSGTFFIFAAICGGTILFIWKMVPETKGRSLEEIQASITN